MPTDQWDQNLAVASVAGAAASALANRSGDNRGRIACEAACGALVGIFVGPGAADALGLTNEHFRMAVGFGIGGAGVALLTMFLDVVKSGSFKQWLARFAPK